jgi:hypothetical protein
MIDTRKNKKVSMNRQPLNNSPFFAIRKNKVKWPTMRKGYMTDENILLLKKYVMGKGRSIIFLEGNYETKLNRYVKKDSTERSVFFEFMLRKKGVKGAIQTLCWIGNFHNGTIIHFGPQFSQLQCWVECLGYEEAMNFFEEACFTIYSEVADILYGDTPKDKEVEEFLLNGRKLLAQGSEES